MTVPGTRVIPALAAGLLLGTAMAAAAEADAPLLAAAQRGDRAAVRALLRQTSDVNVQDVDGTTPLHWAVRNDDVETIKLLLGRRANVKAANRYGVTALSLAAVNGSAPVVGLLLAAGADPNAALPEGETALMTASRTGNVAVVRALLAAGADVNKAEGWQGQTAVMWAAAENHAEVVAALIKAGADLNIRSKVLPGMPQRPRGGDVAQQGVHSNFPKGGLTALHFAVRQNAVAAVSALAEGGVNLDQQDPDGFTPFILAALNGNYDLARLLIERGAGIEAVGQGRPHAALRRGGHAHLRVLVQPSGAEADRRDGQRGSGPVPAGPRGEPERAHHVARDSREVRHGRQPEHARRARRRS